MNSSINFPLRDFKVFEATPGISVLVLVDAPNDKVAAATSDFCSFIGTAREAFLDKGYLQFLDEIIRPTDDSWADDLKTGLQSVRSRKKTHEMPIRQYNLTAKHTTSLAFLQVKSIPVLGNAGELLYIIQTMVDVTEQRKAEDDSASAKGIEKAYRFFMNAPVIIGYIRGPQYVIEMANEGLLKVWGKSKEVIGRPLFEAIPELETQGTRALLDEVCRTGKPFFTYEHPLFFNHNGKKETLYFDFSYQPLYEEDKKVVSGIISVGHDVTTKVRARNNFQNIVEQANDPIVILRGENLELEMANEALFRFSKIDRSAIGKPFLEVFPQIAEQGLLEEIQHVYRTGESLQRYATPVTTRDGDTEKTYYFNVTYQPYREPDGEISGILAMASDATSQVLAKKEAEESFKKWRDLADSMPVIVWSSDPDGNITFFNARWYEFTGLAPAESGISSWIDVLHPEDMSRCLTVWEEALDKEVAYEIEVRYRSKFGNYRWMIARGLPITHGTEVISWYGTSTDIHEQKQLGLDLEDKVRERTEELETKNRLLDNILRHSSNGISVSKMIFDASGNVVDALTILANDSAVKFSGLPRELYLTRPATDFDPNIISSPYGQACINTLKTGQPSVMQYYLEFTEKWLELSVSRMDDSHLIHIFTDVTPIKMTQLRLEKSLEDLQYANKNLEEFAYAASHDLKEPVRKIQYFSNRLKEALKETLAPDQLHLFERLELSSLRMQNLIDDLLEYSQAAKGTSERGDVDLNKLLKTVLEDLELEIQKKQARITVLPLPTVKANERQMQQLFQNLIGNALKYSVQDRIPEIKIACTLITGSDLVRDLPLDEQGKSFHLIEVSDNGIGFDQRDADRIFKVFMRLHSGSLYKGTGVGLSIVKKVVESHHGHVWADSEPGKGAAFKILLPADME